MVIKFSISYSNANENSVASGYLTNYFRLIVDDKIYIRCVCYIKIINKYPTKFRYFIFYEI